MTTQHGTAASASDCASDVGTVLYSNDHARITRCALPGGQSVVVKQALGAQAIRRLAHEADMLKRLTHIAGVPKISAGTGVQSDTLTLEDHGGVSLAEFLRERTLGTEQAVAYGTAVARTLAQVHKAGVIHKDIGPANLLIHPQTLSPTLIDFNIAVVACADTAAAPAADGEIAGTWAYMSPEHTGRTGRAPDARSDLYSLGVTLYQVLTGRKPFESEDLLELVHAHLVQVPAAPADVVPALPHLLSDVVMRLLAKEPEKRYQSAEGLVQDLQRLQRGLAAGHIEPFELGGFDFGNELKPPRALVGRANEIKQLGEALAATADGRHPWLWIGGPAGVGTSALVDELRTLAASRRALFAGGRFTPECIGTPAAALGGFIGIGRQLMALPADELAQVRAQMLEALEGRLGYGVAQLPEFQTLLGPHPATEAGADNEALIAEAAVRLLRVLASAERPVVMYADDVHLSPSLGYSVLEAAAREAARAPMPGLLLVSICPDNMGDEHPASKLLARCRERGLAPTELTVRPLAHAAATQLVGTMLRMPDSEAAPLAQALERHTQHRPGRTIELLNALRRDGLIALGDGHWVWQAEAIRRYVGAASPAELQARLATLPAGSAELVTTLAAMNSHAAWDELVAAIGQTQKRLQQRAVAALDDGLLIDQGEDGLSLTHPQVAAVALAALAEPARRTLHLTIARRLDAASRPEALVARQYFFADSGLADAERRRAGDVLEREGDRLRAAGQIDPSKQHFAAALQALLPIADAADAERLFDLRVKQLQAMFELGRHDEIDVAYAELLATNAPAERLGGPVRFQIYSLLARGRFADAVGQGLALMARLGMPRPDDLRPDLGAGMQRLMTWSRGEERQQDYTRAELSDERALALALVVPETMTPAYFLDPVLWAWLAMVTHRLWAEHGPHPRLLSSVGSLPFLLVGTPQDYRSAHTVSRHLIDVAEKRNYSQGEGISRCVLGIASGHWFEPLETVMDEFHRARVDLLRMREPFAAFTFVAADAALDCRPTLLLALPEVQGGLENAREQRNEDFLRRYLPRQQLIFALRGQTRAPGEFSDEHFDEADYAAKIDPTSATAATYHNVACIRAAIFGDMKALGAHSLKAVPLGARTPGYYLAAVGRVLRCLSLADQARNLGEAERAPLLEELATMMAWLTARAADAPANFAHLLTWIEAERAWAVDTVWAAGAAFGAAVQATSVARPWHRALIHERAALFHLAQGMEEGAKPLLTIACDQYDAWGAAGKVRELKRQHAFLRAASGLSRPDSGKTTTVVGSEMLDLMAVLRASQALSSETSLSRLTDRVSKVLGTITGATGVQLIVRPEEGSTSWVMAHTLGRDSAPMTAEQAGAAGELAFSAFRYAERTGELLLIDDVARDERFSADPFAQTVEQCSLMFSPMVKQGQLHAMLVLENRQRRAAFSGDRLDSVALIAGQLSVSLDNALLYASLEKRVAERTAQLRQKTHDINAMLQNMPQGVLTVVNGGGIHPEYSAYLATIFETTEIADRQVMELVFASASLGADALSQIDAAMASVIGEDEMNYEFNSHLLATEFDKTMADGRVKSLALSWSPIANDEGTVDKLMLCVRDVTELKRLEAEANSRKRELQMIGEILAVSQEKFHEFIDSARAFITENRAVIEKASARTPDGVNLLFRNMHTIKGNARTYGFLGLTNQVHLAEQTYDELRKADASAWSPEQLLAELATVSELVEKYAHVNDTVLGRKGPGRRANVEKFLMVERDTVAQSLQLLMGVDQSDPAAMRLALQHVGSTLHMLGTAPIGNVLAGTIESLPSLAQELGKPAPEVHIEDHGIMLRSQANSLLKNLFTHLLRNSMDHGIELPTQRLAVGKTAAGRIDLRLHVDDNKLWVHLKDDGRGLAVGKIRQRAMAQNLLTRGAKSTPEEVGQLIFRSGFSTAEQVTEVSGRGVGMDAVRAFLEQEGGSIAIRFLDDDEDADFRAFETVIGLPDKYAASLHAAMSFEALRTRLQTRKV